MSSGRMVVPPPADPKKNKNYTSVETKKGLEKELFKLPPVIRNLDLVANLPARTEESEDEYETFDENVVEQQKEISRVDSKLSLHNSHQGSVESVYKAPSSAASYEDEQEDYEIYEAIKEVEVRFGDFESFWNIFYFFSSLLFTLFHCHVRQRIMTLTT